MSIFFLYQQFFFGIKPSTQKAMKSKLNWSQQQQKVLKEAVESNRYATWTDIANFMNHKFPHKNLHGKQYRERYVNHTKFGSNKTLYFSWNFAQQHELFKLYKENGPKWCLFASTFPQKSETCIKNKFYGSIRKMLRKLNQIGMRAQKKINKEIKYEAIMKILDAAEGAEDLPTDIKQESISLRDVLLEISLKWPPCFTEQDCLNLICRIFKFNTVTRCYNSKKWKNAYKSKDDLKLHFMPSHLSIQAIEKQDHLSSINSNASNNGAKQQNEEHNNKYLERNKEADEQQISLAMMCEIKTNYKIRQGGQDLMEELSAILKQKYVREQFQFFQ